MTYTNLAPRTENITGASLSGIDGATGRTYTLSYSNALSSGVSVVVNGTPLHEGALLDFTLASDVLTFVNAIDNTDNIRVNYFTTRIVSSTVPSTTTTALRYATPLQLAAVLGIKVDIPAWEVGATPSREEVGTGDNSTVNFYLDHRNVISDSCTLYYGATSAATTTLTVTTHYSLDNDSGKIVLTTAGKTLLATNKIYAEYSYYRLDIVDSHVIDVLGRAENYINQSCGSYFTDSSQTNPDYPSLLEVQDGQGLFNRTHFTDKRPLVDVVDALAGDIAVGATSLSVANGAQFPSSGYVLIGSEAISYTGVTANTLTGLGRGALGSVAVAHTAADSVHSTIVQVSGSWEGNAVVWTTLLWDNEFFADDSGKVYIYLDQIRTNVYTNNALINRLDVAQRFRINYLYGWDSIPVNITRLTLLLAKRMLINDTIGSALFQGRNEFRPEMANADQEEINALMNLYRTLNIGNT